MSISRYPNGKWRAQVYDRSTGRNKQVPGGPFATKAEAKRAREDYRSKLGGTKAPTVREFWLRWTTDPLFERPKRSTDNHNRERTRQFVDRHADLPMNQVDDQTVNLWLAGGQRNGQVPALRAMWNDAKSTLGGRIVQINPWSGLKISRGPGNRYKQPPSEEMVWSLIAHARRLVSPYFAAYIQVGAFTGMRTGELDALRWTNVDFDAGEIRVREQWSAGSRSFTLPKTEDSIRDVDLTPPAREALIQLPRQSEFCFLNFRDSHFTPSSRAAHWKAVKAAAGWDKSLYLATRHFAGWYMVNVLGLDYRDVAVQLGHSDISMVEKRYGHLDKKRALQRVAEAYARVGNVKPLRVVEGEAG